MRPTILAAATAISLATLAVPLSAQSLQTAAEIAGPADLDRSALEGQITEILANNEVAGAHVVVTFGPDTVYSRAFGTDPSTGGAFKSDTLVRLASASKLITALTVAALVEEGAVSLDDTLGDIDPSLPEAWHDLPVWRVLNHTSGLPMVVTREEFGNMDEARLAAFSKNDLIDIIGDQAPDFKAGENWRYQQSGYALLAHALAQRSYSSWEGLVESKLLKPASLTATKIGNDAAVFQPGENGQERHISNYPAFFASAGGFQTTGEDTRRLLLALAEGLVLNEDSLRRFANDTRRLEKLRGDAEGEGYGMGVAIQRFGDLAFFGHSGGGGLVDIRFAPERQIGIAVVTNRAGGSGAAIAIADLIATQLAGTPQTATE